MREAILPALLAGLLTVGAAEAQTITGKCDPNDVGKRWPPQTFNFDSGSTAIKPADAKRLDEQASLAKANYIQQICLRGQADRQGDAKANERLALARANVIANELVKRGVDRKTIVIEAVGEAGGGASWIPGSGRAAGERRVDVKFAR